MPTSCCAVNCANRSTKASKLHFYKIPAGKTPFERNRRLLWLKAVNRKNWSAEAIKNSFICSEHFINGKRSEDPSDPDFVPSIFMHKKNTVGRGRQAALRKRERFERFKRRSEVEMQGGKKLKTEDESKDENEPHNSLAQKDWIDAELPSTTKISTTTTNDSDLPTPVSALHLELHRLKDEIKQLKLQSKFGFNSIKNCDKLIKFYTGLPNFCIFMWVCNLTRKHATIIKKSLSVEDHLLLVLIKIRLGKLNKELSLTFKLKPHEISAVLRTWIPVVSSVLANAILWPSREVVRKHLPACFQSFRNCRCVIDCTEVFIERPSNFTLRSQTWSTYKHSNTIKYLIGITPSGAVSFISAGAGGRMSDKQLTLDSGFLDKIQSGDDILADRGFLISHEVACKGARLLFPSFTRNRLQLTKREVDTSRRISRARIHVERVIGAVKRNRILQMTIPITLLNFLDDIMIICCGITNLNKSVVPLKVSEKSA